MLTGRDMKRYSRQIAIPDFGAEGQEKLKKSKVVIAGAGGLGSAAGTYLATAGIGHIVIIDDDTVELSNLNRQTLHRDNDIYKCKAASAKEELSMINPDIEVKGIREKITEENAVKLLRGADAVVDCLDNFHTRYILNDGSITSGIPLFHGACREMGGQASVIIPGRTACLKCIFPNPPPTKRIPILGAVAGTIGTIQATEVVKFIAGMKTTLAGKLLLYDARFLAYELIELERNAQCPSCGGIE